MKVKTFSSIKPAALLLLLAMIPAAGSFASVKTMFVSEALHSKLVEVTGVNTAGRYTGQSLRLIIKTSKKGLDSLCLVVDAGLIMKPEDTAYQPMVVAGGDTVVVPPHSTGALQVNIFCGNYPRHCPRTDLKYTFDRVGSDTLVAVLRFINEHSLFDHLGQCAVWAVTNHFDIGSVYDRSRAELSKDFIALLSSITGEPMPRFYTEMEHAETPGTPANQAHTVALVAEFDVRLLAAAILSVGIFDAHGHYIERPVNRQLYPAGRHNIVISFDPRPYGAGRYTIKLMDQTQTLQEKDVEAND